MSTCSPLSLALVRTLLQVGWSQGQLSSIVRFVTVTYPLVMPTLVLFIRSDTWSALRIRHPGFCPRSPRLFHGPSVFNGIYHTPTISNIGKFR